MQLAAKKCTRFNLVHSYLILFLQGYVGNATQCNFGGDYECGVCECDNQHSGQNCEVMYYRSLKLRSLKELISLIYCYAPTVFCR